VTLGEIDACLEEPARPRASVSRIVVFATGYDIGRQLGDVEMADEARQVAARSGVTAAEGARGVFTARLKP
jgi:hypothetical protein